MARDIRFIVDEKGTKTAVVIDLKRHGDLWEDFYDSMVARQRAMEPRVARFGKETTASRRKARWVTTASISHGLRAGNWRPSMLRL